MDQQQATPSQRSQDIQKAELERKKRDLYKAYNPTNQDHQVILNAAISPEIWTIQAKEEAIVPLYVLEKYCDEMADKIIYSKSDRRVIDENNKREEKGLNKMDLHTEQPRLENRVLKELMGKKEQIMRILNRGLYKEYGIDAKATQQIDKRVERDTFDPGISLNDATPTTPTPPPPPVQAVAQVPQPAPAPVVAAPVVEEPDEQETPEKEGEEIKNGNG